MADFVFRLVFFAVAPFSLVLLALLFPIFGVLLDVALALAVFFTSEAARRWTARSKLVNWLISQALEFESF